MAVPAHGLSVWEGVFGPVEAPLERWSFSLKSEPGPSLTDDNMDFVAANLRSAWNANLKPLHFGDVVLTRCRHVQVGGDGKYLTRADGSYVQGIHESNNVGTATLVSRLPLQAAHAVSLVTTRAGATGKGRFFMPQTYFSLDSGFRLNESNRDILADACAQFVRDVNTLVGPIVVASSKGYLSTVTGIRVGRVVDTMRSRREDQDEAYEVVSL